jgi:hypothetical protein
MKPPFWEVTISRQVAAGDIPIIESVNCFAEKDKAEEYRNQALRENPLMSVMIVHVAAVPTDRLVNMEVLTPQTKTISRLIPA